MRLYAFFAATIYFSKSNLPGSSKLMVAMRVVSAMAGAAEWQVAAAHVSKALNKARPFMLSRVEATIVLTSSCIDSPQEATESTRQHSNVLQAPQRLPDEAPCIRGVMHSVIFDGKSNDAQEAGTGLEAGVGAGLGVESSFPEPPPQCPKPNDWTKAADWVFASCSKSVLSAPRQPLAPFSMHAKYSSSTEQLAPPRLESVLCMLTVQVVSACLAAALQASTDRTAPAKKMQVTSADFIISAAVIDRDRRYTQLAHK